MIVGLVTPALHVQSGYGIQARHLCRKLRQDGHVPEVYAISGVGAGTLNIDGVRHWPAGKLAYQRDTLIRNVLDSRAQVVLTLCDLAHQDPAQHAQLRAAGIQVLHWMPIDCEPLSMIDEGVLRYGGGQPVAMSRFGEARLRDRKFEPCYVPHAVDTGTFFPMAGQTRDQLRLSLGVDLEADGTVRRRFAVALAAANMDLSRKGFFEAYEAFAVFHGKHPDSVLLLHSELDGQFDHAEHIRLLGLEEAVIVADDHLIKTGQLDAAYMASWMNTADAGLMASWAEGFGVPAIEYQACGVPVIATDCSALTELVTPGTGWRVPSEAKWNPLHKRRWRAPWIGGIAQALEKAHLAWSRGGNAWQARRERARVFAEGYDVDAVYEQWWRPVLARCEAGDFKVDSKADA